MIRTSAVVLFAAVLVFALIKAPRAADDSADSNAARDPAVQRARQTVRMLDDLYKTNIVMITENYVEDENSYPAGSAAIELFEAMSEKGWHDIRLVDVTGKPIDEENAAQDQFERDAIKQLMAGKDFFEKLESHDGKRVFRAATPVPVVLQKCVLCHEHYADAKPGEPIGIISYSLSIE